MQASQKVADLSRRLRDTRGYRERGTSVEPAHFRTWILSASTSAEHHVCTQVELSLVAGQPVGVVADCKARTAQVRR